jgi:hypothetical protein
MQSMADETQKARDPADQIFTGRKSVAATRLNHATDVA